MLVESITLIGKVLHFVIVRTGNGYMDDRRLCERKSTKLKQKKKITGKQNA